MRVGAVVAPWLLACAQAVAAQAAPEAAVADARVIRSIAFEGNDVTQPSVMLREIVIKQGDAADAVAIERSRQAIQDLGLFRSVEVRESPADGGVAVTFVVEEKWYILPIPRVDANSEGESGAGISVRWFNVWGLNHTLRANWSRRDEEKVNKGEVENYGLSYAMPFVADSPWGLGIGGGHSTTPITDFGGYTETVNSASIGLSRSFAHGPASQGWSAGAALNWSEQATDGPTAPAPYGEATALALSTSYRDLHFNLYSEDGVYFSGAVSGATEGLGSDYSVGSVSVKAGRYVLVGETPHQNVNVFFATASRHGGPTEYETSTGAYALGGASTLRGYPGDFLVGDFYYHLAGEYVRPLYFPWLRGAVVAEVGNAWEDLGNSDSRVYASVGFGIRLRLTFLVNVEVEAGVAFPLDGGSQRFFASKV